MVESNTRTITPLISIDHHSCEIYLRTVVIDIFCSIAYFNSKLLGKWKWYFLHDVNAQKFNLLSFRYVGLSSSLLRKDVTHCINNQSILWRDIMKVREEKHPCLNQLNCNIIVKLGNKDKIIFRRTNYFPFSIFAAKTISLFGTHILMGLLTLVLQGFLALSLSLIVGSRLILDLLCINILSWIILTLTSDPLGTFDSTTFSSKFFRPSDFKVLGSSLLRTFDLWV